MKVKKHERRQSHNIGTHEERMEKRKAQRALRKGTRIDFYLVPIPGTYLERTRRVWLRKPVKTGKYTPATEDKKHRETEDTVLN